MASSEAKDRSLPKEKTAASGRRSATPPPKRQRICAFSPSKASFCEILAEPRAGLLGEKALATSTAASIPAPAPRALTCEVSWKLPGGCRRVQVIGRADRYCDLQDQLCALLNIQPVFTRIFREADLDKCVPIDPFGTVLSDASWGGMIILGLDKEGWKQIRSKGVNVEVFFKLPLQCHFLSAVLGTRTQVELKPMATTLKELTSALGRMFEVDFGDFTFSCGKFRFDPEEDLIGLHEVVCSPKPELIAQQEMEMEISQPNEPIEVTSDEGEGADENSMAVDEVSKPELCIELPVELSPTAPYMPTCNAKACKGDGYTVPGLELYDSFSLCGFCNSPVHWCCSAPCIWKGCMHRLCPQHVVKHAGLCKYAYPPNDDGEIPIEAMIEDRECHLKLQQEKDDHLLAERLAMEDAEQELAREEYESLVELAATTEAMAWQEERCQQTAFRVPSSKPAPPTLTATPSTTPPPSPASECDVDGLDDENEAWQELAEEEKRGREQGLAVITVRALWQDRDQSKHTLVPLGTELSKIYAWASEEFARPVELIRLIHRGRSLAWTGHVEDLRLNLTLILQLQGGGGGADEDGEGDEKTKDDAEKMEEEAKNDDDDEVMAVDAGESKTRSKGGRRRRKKREAEYVSSGSEESSEEDRDRDQRSRSGRRSPRRKGDDKSLVGQIGSMMDVKLRNFKEDIQQEIRTEIRSVKSEVQAEREARKAHEKKVEEQIADLRKEIDERAANLEKRGSALASSPPGLTSGWIAVNVVVGGFPPKSSKDELALYKDQVRSLIDEDLRQHVVDIYPPYTFGSILKVKTKSREACRLIADQLQATLASNPVDGKKLWAAVERDPQTSKKRTFTMRAKDVISGLTSKPVAMDRNLGFVYVEKEVVAVYSAAKNSMTWKDKLFEFAPNAERATLDAAMAAAAWRD